jgi:2-dehydropantoate 2-reductase
MKQVVLFGTGAMSCLFAAHLSKVADVVLVGTWAEAITTIRKKGILFENSQGNRRIRVRAEYLGSSVDPADLVLVLAKSWQSANIAPHLSACLKPDGAAISLQNGLGNIEILGARVSAGSTAEGATLLGPGHVRAGGTGPTRVVAPDWVVDLLKQGGFDAYRCGAEEAESLLWGKLSVSCGINAITALLRILNGELLLRPSAKDLMVRAALECAAVAHARGIRLPFSDPEAQVMEVAARTAANTSSMLQDMLRGAPTECDAINGAVAEEGRRLSIPAPVNEILWQLIKAAAQSNRSELQECVP